MFNKGRADFEADSGIRGLKHGSMPSCSELSETCDQAFFLADRGVSIAIE